MSTRRAARSLMLRCSPPSTRRRRPRSARPWSPSSWPAASVLFDEGDPGDRLYVINDGKIKLGATSSDGRETLLAILGPGEMFGELLLLRPGPAQRDRDRRSPTRSLLGVGHPDLEPWLTGRPEVAASLLAALARRLRRTNEAMADLVFCDVPGRVAKALLDLAAQVRRAQRRRQRPRRARPHPGGAGPARRGVARDGQQGAGRLPEPRLAPPGAARGRPRRPRAPGPSRPVGPLSAPGSRAGFPRDLERWLFDTPCGATISQDRAARTQTPR